MASLNGAAVTVQELNGQQNLLDHLLWTLNNQLSNHNRKVDGVYQSQYHTSMYLNTQHEPGPERLAIAWHCDYCHAVYTHASYLNARHNELYSHLNSIDPIRHPPRAERTDMINRLRPPFFLVPFDMLVEAYTPPTPANCSPEPEDTPDPQG
jgi:hypothetical protein